nr:hypothetical protein [Tanacetum cinerariifolium]
MAKSNSRLDNEVYDDSYCSKSCRKNTENLNTKINKLNEELSDCENDLYHYKIGLSQVEARLVEFKTQEIKFSEKIRGLERHVKVRNNKTEYLTNELEEAKKEKESLDNKLTGFENVSKDLENLLGSQRLDKNKEGLGNSAVPPASAQVYSSLKKDLSWTGLPEFVDDTVTDYSRPTPSIDTSNSVTSVLQSNNSSVSKLGESSGSIMSKPMIKFVKAADCPKVTKTNNIENARKSTYFKDMVMLSETRDRGVQLDAEAEAFLAGMECKEPLDRPLAITTTTAFQVEHEDGYDSDVDNGPHANVAFMANLSATDEQG